VAIAALKRAPQRKTFHATMHVTRVEQWSIEAESVEEARDLLNSGHGARARWRVHPLRGSFDRNLGWTLPALAVLRHVELEPPSGRAY